MNRTFIIAEAGVNHNGSLEHALQLVDVAVSAGADAIKFQTFKADRLVTKDTEQAAYQTDNTGKKESQYAMLKRLELNESHHRVLFEYCREMGIEFMSTAFDDESMNFLHDLGVTRWKIPSGELLSIPYLRKIAQYQSPVILSTGMGELEDVTLAVNTLTEAGLSLDNLTILHANTAYPTPYEDVNLLAMNTLAQQFKTPVGLSDHSLGIEVAIAAVAMGAKVIEKHFTLDNSLPGPDHKASLEPDALHALVQSIRHVEKAMGSGEKTASPSESAQKSVARKRIVAKTKIVSGEPFSEENLTLKRATEGALSQDWDKVVGQIATRDYKRDEGIDV